MAPFTASMSRAMPTATAKFTVDRLFEPFVEFDNVVTVEQRDELHGQLSHRAKFRCLRIEVAEELGDFGIDLIGSLAQVPGTAST
jgi:hypothetical protein